MILSYGFSHVGLSHIKTQLPCQDAHCYKTFDNGWAIAAIADGLGSSAHSERASQLAVDTFAQLDSALLPASWDDAKLCELLRVLFADALDKINKESQQNAGGVGDYNTTLTAVIFDGSSAAYGHCGDGGIIGLAQNGNYHMLTKTQKGEEANTVVPLNFGLDYCQFGCSSESFCSLLLMTDGLLDVAQPALLRTDTDTGGIYIPFVRQFMDAGILGITQDNTAEIDKAVASFFVDGPSLDVTDDKTLVCLIRSGFSPPVLAPSYYAEPDWQHLRGEQNKRLYTTQKKPTDKLLEKYLKMFDALK